MAKRTTIIISAAAIITAALILLFNCKNSPANTPAMQYAIISTEKGDMKAELYTNDTPGTVANFVKLSNERFYDGLTFHRVIPDFVIQGGCPNGTGSGSWARVSVTMESASWSRCSAKNIVRIHHPTAGIDYGKFRS